jgi:phage terminase small subunit
VSQYELKKPKLNRYGTNAKPITQTETYRKQYVTHTMHPLTFREARFIDAYMVNYDGKEAVEKAGFKVKNKSVKANELLKKDYIADEIVYRTELYASECIADRQEVMEYLTAGMRGEIKDQFGLDAPMSERTACARELKKILIDEVERGKNVQAQQVVVNIDMNRNEDDGDGTPEINIEQLSD